MFVSRQNQRSFRSFVLILSGGLLLPAFAHADVTYQEVTQINGGSLTGMLKLAGVFSSQIRQLNAPVTSTVMIHGSRMVRSSLHHTTIVDLDQQTVTLIDNDKHTFAVATFQQMQEQLSKSASQAKGTNTSGPQLTFNARLTSTGATRTINGQTATESLLSVTSTSSDATASHSGMAAALEVWSVPNCPGLEELRAFKQRLGQELSMQADGASMTGLLSSQPGGAQAVTELQKESAKMTGCPVLQVTRVDMTADGQALPAPSVAPLPQTKGEGTSTAASVTKEVGTETATQTARDQMGRFGSFGRALSGSTLGALTKRTQKATPAASGSTADPTSGVLMEAQSQSSGFSTAPVDPAVFTIPAGYKAVASPIAALVLS